MAVQLLLLASPAALPAQLATLLKDIHPTIDHYGSNPRFLGSVGETAYFAATPAGGTVEGLWATSGTPETTRRLAVPCREGDCPDRLWTLGSHRGWLYLVGSGHFFPSSTFVLLAVDASGEEAVPLLLGSNETRFSQLGDDGTWAFFGDEIFFEVTDNVGGRRLVAIDPEASEPRTVLVFEEQGPSFGLTSVGERIVFLRAGDIFSTEVWRSDGTTAGTVRASTLEGDAQLRPARASTSRVVFGTWNPDATELWGSDGTAAGTALLRSFADPDTAFSPPVRDSGPAFLFVEEATSGQELWATDGTTAGTKAVTAFGYHAPFGDLFTGQPAVIGDTAYFFVNDGIDSTALWRAGAQPGSASAVVEVCEGGYGCVDTWIETAGSTLFFLRDDPATGQEVWRSDGTPGGTALLEDACPGDCWGGGEPLAADAGRFAYAAANQQANFSTVFVAEEPWNGGASLFDESRNAPRLSLFPELRSATFAGPRLYFPSARQSFETEPWVSSGTAATTFQLAEIGAVSNSGSSPSQLAATSGTLAFFANDGFHRGLWFSEGDQNSTRSVPGFPDSEYRSPPQGLPAGFVLFGDYGSIAVADPGADSFTGLGGPGAASLHSGPANNGQLAVAIYLREGILELWKSEGSPGSTAKASTIDPTFAHSELFSVVNGRFLLRSFTHARLEALSADLTAITPISPVGVVPDRAPVPSNASLAFFASGDTLWRTDGTAAGTFELPIPGAVNNVSDAEANGAGFDLLVAKDGTEYEIWRSDGTSQGTFLRASIDSHFYYSGVASLRRVGNRLFAAFPVGDTSSSLWTVADDANQAVALDPGSTAFDLENFDLGESNGRLVFNGCEPVHGCELWTSDGTADGTRLMQEIFPGPAGSRPEGFFETETNLFFTANDGIHDYELWTLPRTAGPDCRQDHSTLCLENGRFQAVATWRRFDDTSGDAAVVTNGPDTGMLWFFDPANVELVLKVIDGGGYNGHHWVFYGALTNVEYLLTLTDSETGAAKRYFNPATRFASGGDITAFGPQGAHAKGGASFATTRQGAIPRLTELAASPAQPAGACLPAPERFCILDGRFAVEATWRDFQGNTGVANGSAITDDTGYLWFFDESNVEVVLKAVDGSDFNDHFWIYFGALSNVEYTITVTDTVAGTFRTYHNTLGKFASFGDIEAFPAP